MPSIVQEPNAQDTRSVLLVEPDDAIRESLLNRLRRAMPECRVMGRASPEEAIALHPSESPSVVVVDVANPDVDGLNTIGSIKGAMHRAQLIALTMSDNTEFCESLARAGASASVLIWQTDHELLPAIRGLLADEST